MNLSLYKHRVEKAPGLSGIVFAGKAEHKLTFFKTSKGEHGFKKSGTSSQDGAMAADNFSLARQRCIGESVVRFQRGNIIHKVVSVDKLVTYIFGNRIS